MYKRVVYFPAVVSEKIEAMAGQDKKHFYIWILRRHQFHRICAHTILDLIKAKVVDS
jgi:hypothetical protein